MRKLVIALLIILSLPLASYADFVEISTRVEERLVVSDEISPTKRVFIETLYPELRKFGLDKDVITMLLSQSAIESRWGDSWLSKYHNNYFGIKYIKKNKKVSLPTLEWSEDRGFYKVKANFSKYDSISENVKDRLRILEKYKDRGYATDPNYNKKIKKLSKAVDSYYDIVEDVIVDTKVDPNYLILPSDIKINLPKSLEWKKKENTNYSTVTRRRKIYLMMKSSVEELFSRKKEKVEASISLLEREFPLEYSTLLELTG